MKVHFHSDCESFAGCEQMLTVLIPALADSADFEVTFSYRSSPKYQAGLDERLGEPCSLIPLKMAEVAEVESALRRQLRGRQWRPVRAAALSLLRGLPFRQGFQIADTLRLLPILRRVKPDLIHINNGGYPGAGSANAAVLAARIAGVPAVVYVVNNMAYGYESPLRWADYPLDRWVAGHVDRFVTGSSAAAARLSEVLTLDGGRAVALPNGIRVRQPDERVDETRSRLGIAPGDFLFATVGNCERRKGHRVLLDAIASLRRSGQVNGMSFVIEGEGPDRAALEMSAQDLGIEALVRFIGYEDNVWNLMHACDAFLLPSIKREDFPNVTLEAMACAKPVAASSIAGTPEQIEQGVTGLLVEPGDPVALGSAIVDLASDADAARAMGMAGRRRFEAKYTAERATGRYVDLYRELLGTGR